MLNINTKTIHNRDQEDKTPLAVPETGTWM